MQHFTRQRLETWLSNLQVIFLIFFAGTSALQAQAPFVKWDKTIGGTESDLLTTAIHANDGGNLIGGTTYSGVGAEKTTPTYGGGDYWVAMVNEKGVKMWDKTYGGTASERLSIILPLNGEGYLLGGTSASPVSGNKMAPGKGKEDFWIIKVNNRGGKLWEKCFGGNGKDVLTTIRGVDGGFILGGTSASGISGDKTEPNWGGANPGDSTATDYWVVKIDDQGEIQWDKTFGGIGNDELVSVLRLGSGYLLAGNCDSAGGDRTCNAPEDNNGSWVVKISDQGTKQWDRCYGSSQMKRITTAIVGSRGVLIGGYGDYKFWPRQGLGLFDFNVIYIDEYRNGNIVWKKEYGGEREDIIKSIIPARGGYLLGGDSFSGVSGDKTDVSYGAADYWIVRITEDGEKQWDRSLGGEENDYLSALSWSKDGFVLAGTSESPISGVKSEGLHNSWDFWVVKVAEDVRPEVADVYYRTCSGSENIMPIISNPQQVSKVEFFIDEVKIGEDESAPFEHAPVDLAPGVHNLRLKVVDKAGIFSFFSKPFNVSEPQASFYRAINLNGPDQYIDCKFFQSSSTASNFTYQARKFENQSVPLIPATDVGRTRMLRSSLYSTQAEPALFNFTNIPQGAYEVYLYIWENDNPQTFSISVNGSVATPNQNSGYKGQWAKLGPFKTNVNGTIEIKVEGGDANVSGIELWKIDDYESFYRAVNLNGPTYKINNLSYTSSNVADNFSYTAKSFANQSVPLGPLANGDLALMIRSSLYSTNSTPATFTFTSVPAGIYDVYAYVWEDNYSQNFYLSVQGETRFYNSGEKGQWKIIGPLEASVISGDLRISAGGGDANISAIEVWKRSGLEPAKLSRKDEVSKAVVYPNSISDRLTISLPANQKGSVSAKIVDITGRTYVDKTKDLNDENQLTLDIPDHNMKTGIYFLHIQYEGKKEVIRLSKE